MSAIGTCSSKDRHAHILSSGFALAAGRCVDSCGLLLACWLCSDLIGLMARWLVFVLLFGL